MRDLDALRIFALGRIPRCSHCPRYRVLASSDPVPLPKIPSDCNYQVCAPLVKRHPAVDLDRGPKRRSGGLRLAGGAS